MKKEAQYIELRDALKLVKSNDSIVSGMVAAEARLFLSNLHTISDQVEDVIVTNCLPFENAEFFTNPKYKESFSVDSWFYSSALRKSAKHGMATYIPNHLHLASHKRFQYKKPDIYVGIATKPDKHGYVSLSISNVYEQEAIANAKIVILEVSNNFPRTFGDVELHISKIDYMIEVDYELAELPDLEPNEKDMKIGQIIADLIPDGSTIQLGIGGIPNAVAASLVNKKDLGIHTEMFTTGLMKLVKAGAVNGSKKTLHKNKHVACFAMGTKELYDFIDNNPSVAILNGKYVNDPFVISKNDNQVSINTTIEVDLTGQCVSESIGPVQFSGTGGQSDTAVGAQRSKNGKSFIATYSTAMVRVPGSDERVEVSKIVSTLKPGAFVTLSRNDVDYVVTEYGAVSLRGTSVKERVDLLISIAHPKFRKQLRKEALEVGFINE